MCPFCAVRKTMHATCLLSPPGELQGIRQELPDAAGSAGRRVIRRRKRVVVPWRDLADGVPNGEGHQG